MALSPDTLEYDLAEAIEARDAVRLRQLIDSAEFVLIAVAEDEGDEEEDEEASASVFSTQVDEADLLVAFTNEEAASEFVSEMGEEFDDDEEIEGYVLDGDALLDYMPPEHGLFLNPESEDPMMIDEELLGLIQKADGQPE
ncbi:MAG: SseB family protein [Planctomycetota bacterium]